MICIKKGKVKALTEGKNYEVIKMGSGVHQGSNLPYAGIWIINDNNIKKYYTLNRFVDLSEWRSRQINILIDEKVE